ncbi:hypothetical protein FIBSPDRAFT_865768 [Athelia psychrophila]|uniref:Large ribosomal subunit protein uL23m n=1 Tax=Athelia psychrophila TaxID=1759441 RepID=A0A166FBC2_9AGAM|nr:hypothetical protein FIBSPDRAFT_865768 [Fibularhizoctonia sp. CBS 109695]
MQSTFSTTLRRAYATHSRAPLQARQGRNQSAPLAVRKRRAAQGTEQDKLEDVQPLSPSEHTSYKRNLMLGRLMGQGKDGTEPSATEWLAKLNSRRNRIRGIHIKEKDGKKEVQAVGQKVYLPNILFRLIRNFTPPGQPYNPYEANFRVPQSVTKTDIRSYLLSVYGVETTYIRTDNFLSPLYRARFGGVATKAHKTYKKAIVGLVKPFEYPAAIEDMSGAAREKTEEWLEKSFGIMQMKHMRRGALLAMTRKGSDRWKWRNTAVVRRSQILKAIGESRTKREQTLNATRQLMDEAQQEKRPVTHVNLDKLQSLVASQVEVAAERRKERNFKKA